MFAPNIHPLPCDYSAQCKRSVAAFRVECVGWELLSNLVFESFWSCGDLAFWGGFNSVFERDACDDFGEVVKAA